MVPALKQRVSYRNAEWPRSAITPMPPLFGRPADPQCELAQSGSGSRSPGYKHAQGQGTLLRYYTPPPPNLLFNETVVPVSMCLVHTSCPQDVLASKLHYLHQQRWPYVREFGTPSLLLCGRAMSSYRSSKLDLQMLDIM